MLEPAPEEPLDCHVAEEKETKAGAAAASCATEHSRSRRPASTTCETQRASAENHSATRYALEKRGATPPPCDSAQRTAPRGCPVIAASPPAA